MAQVTTELKWITGISFQSTLRDHKIIMDSRKEVGGQNLGPTPKELLLAGICGCSGMDVVSLLKKYKINFTHCDISAETETRNTHPAIFGPIKLFYKIEIQGEFDSALVLKAVELSMTKYCGVSAMVNPVSPISYEVSANGQLLGQGQARFEITP